MICPKFSFVRTIVHRVPYGYFFQNKIKSFERISVNRNLYFFVDHSLIGPTNTNVRETTQMGLMEPTSLDYSSHSLLDSLGNTSNAGSSTTINNKRTRDLAICAVILDEWLKELAAISQEQSIVMLTEIFINHF